MSELTHIDEQGRANMVDVSDKAVTKRTARARSIVSLPAEVMAQIIGGDIQSKKGPVFQTAILAGIMAAKKTGDLIPLCHPLSMDNCNMDISVNHNN